MVWRLCASATVASRLMFVSLILLKDDGSEGASDVEGGQSALVLARIA